MSLTRGLAGHLSVALLFLITLGAPALAQTRAAEGPARFTVILKGVRIGAEVVDVTRTTNNIRITSTGQILAPFELTTSRFEMIYGLDWQPLQLSIEGQLRGQLITLATTFGLTTATSDMMQAGQRGSVTQPVTPRAVVLPNNFFAAYEALAARLNGMAVGARIPVYVVPEAEVGATITRITPRRVVGPETNSNLQQFDLNIGGPTSPSVVQVWIDERSRLARVDLPAVALVVIREDLATVLAREEHIKNPGDDSLYIPASGFSLGATITRPTAGTGRAPAVILVGGPGRQDRDETLYSVPMFGQIAGRLADAGYFVVRYDKRGVGQSGGRPEHAGIAGYAEDLIAIVTWLRKRADVDAERVGVIAHGEGAVVALTAAGRERRIRSLVLLEAPGKTGRDLTLEQQQALLLRLKEPESERQAKVATQMKVMDAVISGKGWDALPPELRRQADTPWFKSWLLFDPAVAFTRVNQPVLIIHGALDTQIPPSHADRLEEMARARKRVAPEATRKIIVPKTNHLLVPAVTGDVEEYQSLAIRTVAPEVTTPVIEWLKATLVKAR